MSTDYTITDEDLLNGREFVPETFSSKFTYKVILAKGGFIFIKRYDKNENLVASAYTGIIILKERNRSIDINGREIHYSEELGLTYEYSFLDYSKECIDYNVDSVPDLVSVGEGTPSCELACDNTEKSIIFGGDFLYRCVDIDEQKFVKLKSNKKFNSRGFAFENSGCRILAEDVILFTFNGVRNSCPSQILYYKGNMYINEDYSHHIFVWKKYTTTANNFMKCFTYDHFSYSGSKAKQFQVMDDADSYDCSLKDYYYTGISVEEFMELIKYIELLPSDYSVNPAVKRSEFISSVLKRRVDFVKRDNDDIRDELLSINFPPLAGQIIVDDDSQYSMGEDDGWDDKWYDIYDKYRNKKKLYDIEKESGKASELEKKARESKDGRYAIMRFLNDCKLNSTIKYDVVDVKDSFRLSQIMGIKIKKSGISEYLSIDDELNVFWYDFIGKSYPIKTKKEDLLLVIEDDGFVYIEKDINNVRYSIFTGIIFEHNKIQYICLHKSEEYIILSNGISEVNFPLNSMLLVRKDKLNITESLLESKDFMSKLKRRAISGEINESVERILDGSIRYGYVDEKRRQKGFSIKEDIATLYQDYLISVNRKEIAIGNVTYRREFRYKDMPQTMRGYTFLGSNTIIFTYLSSDGIGQVLYHNGDVYFLRPGEDVYLVWFKGANVSSNNVVFIKEYVSINGKKNFGCGIKRLYSSEGIPLSGIKLSNLEVEDFLKLTKYIQAYYKVLVGDVEGIDDLLSNKIGINADVRINSKEEVFSEMSNINFPKLNGQLLTMDNIREFYSSGEYLVDMDRYTGKDVEGMKKLVDWLSNY